MEAVLTPETALPVIRLLIIDIDNTVFDWFHFWFHSFNAMVNQVLRHVRVERPALLDEIREVHQRHKTTEYSWVLEELPSIARLPKSRRDDTIRVAQHEYREARKRTEHLYPGVYSTLSQIKQKGTKLVGFTESQRFYTIQRLMRFGLDGLLDVLYCTKEHGTPSGIDLAKERSKPAEAYLPKSMKVVELQTDIRKPNPQVLLSIVSELRATPRETLYIGDSKMKDVYMAQGAGVHDAYAEYGDSMNKAGYDLLRAVSSWTGDEIAKEKVMAVEVTPTIVLQHSFAEILSHFRFSGSSNDNSQEPPHGA